MKRTISFTMAMVFIILSFISLCCCNRIDPLSLEGYSEIDNDDLFLIKLITPYPSLISNDIESSLETDIPSSELSLIEALSQINEGFSTFYLTEVSKTNYFLLCGYENYYIPSCIYSIYSIFSDDFSLEIYDWYKVNKLENVQAKIGDASLKFVYLVLECTVKKDIINDTDVNYHRRYYLALDADSIDTYDVDALIDDEIVVLDDKTMDISSSFQNRFMYYTEYDLGYDYWFLTADDKKQFLAIKDAEYGSLNGEMILLHNYYKSIFSYYPELYEYFEIIDDLNYYYQGDCEYNSMHFTNFCTTYRGIDLETLKYVFANNVLGENK